MPNDIFISYSRRDETFIKQLYQALIDRGVSAWYDRENIGVGNQWASDIVIGIRECKIFLLVLSPDSTASPNVRKEVDLAMRHNKQIVPLIWRTTEIPVAMEYQLAGIQWIEFNESATDQKFTQLVEVLQGLMGGSSMAEATSSTSIAKESSIPAVESTDGEAAPSPGKKRLGGGRRRLSGRKKKQAIAPLGVGAAVISGVVTTFGLDVEEQDFVNTELKWLFSAADNFVKVRSGDADPSQPVSTPIPEDAEVEDNANNQLLMTNDFDLKILEGQLESKFTQIQKHLKNLDLLLEQEASEGPDAAGNVKLQNQIKSVRRQIVSITNDIAAGINQAYGVFVTSPDQLLEMLE